MKKAIIPIATLIVVGLLAWLAIGQYRSTHVLNDAQRSQVKESAQEYITGKGDFGCDYTGEDTKGLQAIIQSCPQDDSLGVRVTHITMTVPAGSDPTEPVKATVGFISTARRVTNPSPETNSTYTYQTLTATDRVTLTLEPVLHGFAVTSATTPAHGWALDQSITPNGGWKTISTVDMAAATQTGSQQDIKVFQLMNELPYKTALFTATTRDPATSHMDVILNIPYSESTDAEKRGAAERKSRQAFDEWLESKGVKQSSLSISYVDAVGKHYEQ